MASLATLLTWSGETVTEGGLVELYRVQTAGWPVDALADQGLHGGQLIELAAAAGTGVSLAPALVTVDQAAVLAVHEPFMVHLLGATDRAGMGRGHWVLIAGYSKTRGFLRADPSDGKYAFETRDDFRVSAGRFRNDHLILILRARRDGRPAAAAEPLAEEETRDLPSVDVARLLRSAALIPPGRTAITVSVGPSQTSFDMLDLPGFSTDMRSVAATLSVRHALRNGMEISGQAPIAYSQSRWRFEDAAFDFPAEREIGPVSLGMAAPLKLGRFSGSSNAALSFTSRVKVVGVGGGAVLSRPLGRDLVLRLGGQLQGAKTAEGWSRTLDATVGLMRPVGAMALVWGDATQTLPLDRHATGATSVTIGADRQLTRQFSIGAYVRVTWGVQQNLRGRTAGLSLTWVPTKKIGTAASRR